MNMCEPSTAPTTYGMLCKFWNFCANLSITMVEGHLINFLNNINFMAPLNWETATWLVEKPILYKWAMLCIKLLVANLHMDTVTFTWTGTANRMFVSYLVMKGARVLHKYSNVDTSMRIRPLNSLALNDLNKFWSKKPGWWNSLSRTHTLRGRDARSHWQPCIANTRQHNWCHCHISIFPWCVVRVSKAMILTTAWWTKLQACAPLAPCSEVVVWSQKLWANVLPEGGEKIMRVRALGLMLRAAAL